MNSGFQRNLRVDLLDTLVVTTVFHRMVYVDLKGVHVVMPFDYVVCLDFPALSIAMVVLVCH